MVPASTLSPLPNVFPKIDRHPAAADWGRGSLQEIPAYNPSSDETWQVDLRTYNVSQLDLRNSVNDLLHASFDTQTQWPQADKMPSDFDWQHIMDLGKNPGLGIRQLHARGVTGRGVGIAIIDQTLLVDHQEYKDQLRLYEEASDIQGGWLETQTWPSSGFDCRRKDGRGSSRSRLILHCLRHVQRGHL
jgi:hypothetical protein